MTPKPNDFKLGLFIISGLALIIAALIIFGASKIFEPKTIEETYTAGDVAGLKTGAPVLLRGVPVGEVTRINFSWNIYHRAQPRYVVVEFDVRDKVSMVPPGPGFAERIQQEVDRGLRARIKTQGLAGATIVSLEFVDPKQYPPLPFPWKPRHIYIPSAAGGFSEILASLGSISSGLKEVDFKQLGAQVQTDLASVESLIQNLNQINVPALGSNVNALVTDLREVSFRLQAFVGQTNELSRENLQRLSGDAGRLLTRLDAAAGRLEQMAGNLNENSLNASLDNIQRASRELAETVHQLKEYPSGAIFGKPPPPAKSVQSPR